MYLHSTIVLHHLPWATSFLSAQFFARTQDKYALLDKWLLIVVTIQITSHQNSPSTWGASYLSVSRNIRGKLLRIRKQYLQLWVRISTLNVSNWGERNWKHWININLNGKWRCELYPRKRLWLWHDHISINSLKHTISKVSTCWEPFSSISYPNNLQQLARIIALQWYFQTFQATKSILQLQLMHRRISSAQ